MQQRQKRRSQTDGAEKISGNDGFRVGESVRLGLQLLDPHDTRVIDEDVQRRIARRHLARKRAYVDTVFDVQRKRSHAGVRGGDRVQYLLAAASDDDVISEGVEGFRKAAANAGAATRDQDCVAGSLHCDLLFLFPWIGCNGHFSRCQPEPRDPPHHLPCRMKVSTKKKAVGRTVCASHCWDRVLLCCVNYAGKESSAVLPPMSMSPTAAVRPTAAR